MLCNAYRESILVNAKVRLLLTETIIRMVVLFIANGMPQPSTTSPEMSCRSFRLRTTLPTGSKPKRR